LLLTATLHRLLHRGATSFLDIACVPQEDAAGKAQGIARLGAVLARSEYMILLVDEFYWTRLWCIFEVAAFCRHAERSRLVVLPLHVGFVELGFFGCILAFLPMSILVRGSGILGMTSVSAYYVLLPTTVMITVPILIAAHVSGRRSREALHALRDFSIDDAQCQSADDRRALIAVICEWYTDTRAGEIDPQRLLELGRHKFEMFVRHDLAPSIERQERSTWRRATRIVGIVVMHPIVLLIGVCPAAITLPEAAINILVWAWFVPLVTMPIVFRGSQIGAAVVHRLVDRIIPKLAAPRTLARRALVAVAYALGAVSAISVIPVIVTVRIGLCTPNQIFAPEWTFPDDGLDADTRRFAKQWLVLSYHVVALAVWSLQDA
jgi:hypothetical protein